MWLKACGNGGFTTIALLMPLQVAYWPIGSCLTKGIKNPRASGASYVLFREHVFRSPSPSMFNSY